MLKNSRLSELQIGLALCTLIFTLTCASDTTATNNGSSTQSQVATPVFTPGANMYSTDQSVSISTTTSGATIYYTTDGVTTPTTSSSVFSSLSPIAVNGHGISMTIKALAVKSGMTNSSIATGNFVISYPPHMTSLSCTPIGSSPLVTSDVVNCTVGSDSSMTTATVQLKDTAGAPYSAQNTLSAAPLPGTTTGVMTTPLNADAPGIGTIYPWIKICDASANCNIYLYNALTPGFYHLMIGTTDFGKASPAITLTFY